MKYEVPRVRVLRSKDENFIGAYPFPYDVEFPTRYPCEDMLLHGSVASASDCTGIAVVQPISDSEAHSLSDICGAPITSVEGDGLIEDDLV